MTVEAREKVSASAVKLRNRERRNSFRQAVDRVDRFGRPYEPIWFGDERDQLEDPDDHSPRADVRTGRVHCQQTVQYSTVQYSTVRYSTEILYLIFNKLLSTT